MNTSVDSNTEKIFFNFTILNPQYIRYVHGYFFKNEHIKFVYDSIRNDFMQSDKNLEYSLSQKEIISLVKMYDEKDFVERDFIKSLLKYNPDDYTDEFVMKRYEPWVRANSLLNGLMNSYESMRDINIIDLDTVEKALGDVRRNIDTALDISLKQGNIGLDFDDVDAHDQQLEVNKISSGFDSIDQILDGGFDRKTINFFMGAPGTGKSLTLNNLAVNMANEGYNVGFVTLELSEKKTLKRIGSMALEIPIYEYNERAKDRDYMKRKMAERDNRLSGGLGRYKTGKLYIKEFPSGTATVSDIDAWCQQVEDETGNKLDALFVDYLQIMNTEGGVDRNMLYLKGEHLSVGLRAITQKRNLVGFSATQTDKNKYGANTYNLNDIPESKAIADTADTVWGIVLTPVMKAQKIYQWQPLKLRDSSTDIERVEFDFNPEYLRLVNDRGIIQSL